MLVLSRGNSRHILTTNWQDDIPHVEVLHCCQLATLSDNDLVTGFAEVLLVVSVEVTASVEPDSNLLVMSVPGDADLKQYRVRCYERDTFRYHVELKTI